MYPFHSKLTVIAIYIEYKICFLRIQALILRHCKLGSKRHVINETHTSEPIKTTRQYIWSWFGLQHNDDRKHMIEVLSPLVPNVYGSNKSPKEMGKTNQSK